MSINRNPLPIFFLGVVAAVVGAAQGAEPVAARIDGKRVALVVGNNSYADRALPFARADASAVAGALRELDFEVTLLLDADLETFERTVNRFISDLEADSTALFFYIGHGFQVDGENFLLAVDANPADEIDAKYQSYSASRVLQRMEARKTRINIVILDAFRGMPFPLLERSVKEKGAAPILSSATQSSFIALSNTPGRITNDPSEGEHGPFAGAFLEAIDNPGLTLDELFNKVREKVHIASGSSQTPWTNSGVIEDFYINPTKPTTETHPLPLSSADKSPPFVSGKVPPGRLWIDPILGVRFRSISPGTFIMGSPSNEPGRDVKVKLTRLRKIATKTKFPLGEVVIYQQGSTSPVSQQISGTSYVRYKYTTKEEVIIDETLHQVTLSRAFWLAETEVTQEQWRRLIGTDPSTFQRCGDGCPVETINRAEAQYFANLLSKEAGYEVCYVGKGCQKTGKYYTCNEIESRGPDCKGYRLPTEAEWEYAARALTTTATQDLDLDAIAWYNGNSGVSYRGGRKNRSKLPEGQHSAKRCGTHPVGLKGTNAWGLHDMLGNVAEWVDDVYGPYHPGAMSDPTGPPRGYFPVARGCSWSDEHARCRVASRFVFGVDVPEGILGFRLARTLDEGEIKRLEGSD